MEKVSLKDYTSDTFYWKLTNKIELTRHGTYHAFKFLFHEGYLDPVVADVRIEPDGSVSRYYRALKEFHVTNNLTDPEEQICITIDKGRMLYLTGSQTGLIHGQFK